MLYGSCAKGNYRPGSDIELALDDLLLPWKIDLSLYSQIDNPALVEHIGRVDSVLYMKG